MPHFPKLGLFTPDDIQQQIDAIEEFTNNFIKEHSSVFEKDTDGTYIEFDFTHVKEDGDDKRIDFGVSYNDAIPINIRNEFDYGLKKLSGK